MTANKPCSSTGLIPVKSKYNTDILRFSINKLKPISYEEFKRILEQRHGLGQEFSFFIWYLDPTDDDLLPINNEDNFKKSLSTSHNLLRIFLQRKGEKLEDMKIVGSLKRNKKYDTSSKTSKSVSISNPLDFRQVSAIIDADILPKKYRRIQLLKHKTDKPLGFYLRDGESYRKSTDGSVKKVPGVFISRIIPGGLVESTGLLCANDEVLEVNGVEVLGKSLDQVTDMMIANSSNLIITVKPGSEPFAITKLQGSFSSLSFSSAKSHHSTRSSASMESDEDEQIYHV